MNKDNEKLNKVLISASVLNILGLILAVVSLLKLTPVTLMVSMGLGGLLIAVALLLYLYAVVQDLRMRKVL
jgi:hypothetical protein